MEQPYENISVENMNTLPETQQTRSYKKAMRTILEIARDHFDETSRCLEEVFEECSN